MSPQPITRHIVLITGFRQKHGRPTTGLDELWRGVHAAVAGPASAVWLCSWNDDFRTLAARINNYRDAGGVRIAIVAYSWGVGVGALRLARALQQYGLRVEMLFAIDGVYRPWFPLPLRSLFSRWNPWAPRIVVPWNVQGTWYWRQDRNRPQGHELVAEVPDCQSILPGNSRDGLQPGRTHQTIDNCDEIHRAILERITHA